jgi:4-hydroxy-3-polyprenylbenzoate decarboxylase
MTFCGQLAASNQDCPAAIRACARVDLARVEQRIQMLAARQVEHKASARQADFVIEGCVDPTEPLRDEGPVGDHGPLRGKSAVRNPKSESNGAASLRSSGFSLPSDFDIRHSEFPCGVFHNLVFVSIKKTYPMQAYKIMHGLWGWARPACAEASAGR